VGLFRYALISDALDQALSTKQRGRLVRDVAAQTHPGPFGTPVQVSRASLDRWIRDYRASGFAALVPTPRRVLARLHRVPATDGRVGPHPQTPVIDLRLATGFDPSRTQHPHLGAAGLLGQVPRYPTPQRGHRRHQGVLVDKALMDRGHRDPRRQLGRDVVPVDVDRWPRHLS
jgi:hypothetical protein